VERIHELIGTTDILITKAGGITSTEASQAAPLLLFANSIAGLEDKNEEFFVKQGAACVIDKGNAKKIMGELLCDKQRMAKIRANLQRIGKKKTAINIGRVIIQAYQKK
jgi:processive 1,2-diacylglycerol beta-glucosyltransferase